MVIKNNFAAHSIYIMSLSHLVKFNSVNNLSDARYAAGMGVQFLGLEVNQENFQNDSHLKLLEDLCSWVIGPEIVLEATGLENFEVELLIDKLPFSALETTNLSLLAESSLTPIWAVDWSPTNLLDELISHAKLKLSTDSALIIHLKIAPSNFEAAISDISSTSIPENWQIIISWDFNSSRLSEVLEKHNISGISFTPGYEEKPGLKDFTLIAEILESLEIED